MDKTLVILKPSCLQRSFVGDVISRFEKKGLRLAGMKMMQLDDSILNIHYAHLKDKPFFEKVKKSMKASPVIAQCWVGVDAAKVVRQLIGVTNGRNALPGTIRGDFAMSAQENIVHASDSAQSAEIELKRFFADSEIFDYQLSANSFLYDIEEINN